MIAPHLPHSLPHDGAEADRKSLESRAPPAKSQEDPQDEVVHTPAGVLLAEAMAVVGYRDMKGRRTLWALVASFGVYATSSFQDHSSGLATTAIVSGVVSAVCVPFLAKLADVFNRPILYLFVLVAYTVGYVVVLKSPNIQAWTAGNVLTAVGTSGLSLLVNIVCADFVPLAWRGFFQGGVSAPFIIIPWFAADIVDPLAAKGDWRWGYGMFAIMMPVVMLPGIFLLFHLQHRAKAEGVVLNAVEEKAEQGEKVAILSKDLSLGARLVLTWHELDGFGLLLLGFGWSLILLPFSLASGANGGYHNPSLIAMFVIGGVLLISYAVFEAKWARFPSAPMRLLGNKNFVLTIFIDFIYMMAGTLQLLYLASYAFIAVDWDIKQWTYFNNSTNVVLSAATVITGLLLRYTHHYKLLQIIGLAIKAVGYGIMVDRSGVRDTARLVMSQVLIGFGGAFSALGNQVALQACVPHTDVALALSLLTLWSTVGGSIGSAIAAAVWNGRMPSNLRRYIPETLVDDAGVALFFADITQIKAYAYDSPVRQGAIRAYEETVFPLWAAALGISLVVFVAAFFQSNYYLGAAQNAYDFKDVCGNIVEGERGEPEKVPVTGGWKGFLRFWDRF
ncbi:hypothetical protein JCM8547_007597 [Rhodosporidiobolus lusitaniae]